MVGSRCKSLTATNSLGVYESTTNNFTATGVARAPQPLVLRAVGGGRSPQPEIQVLGLADTSTASREGPFRCLILVVGGVINPC